MKSYKNKSRTYNVVLNSLAGIIAVMITIVLNFGVRVILVRQLGEEINGIHNLFQSIANVIALLEAEISAAMIIHLYKPIKEKNQEKTKEIMALYRKSYFVLAALFAVVSCIVDFFFMDNLVTSTIDMKKIKMLFLVFALSFVVKYLTYHKRSILYGEQKNRVSVLTNTACELIFRSLEIISVILFKQYFIFLCLMVLEGFTSNVICSKYVDKYHPYLNSYKNVNILESTKKAIIATVKPMFVNRISSTVQQSAKSILVSILLGNISVVGYFGNYQLVESAVQSLFTQLGGAFTTGFGNLAVENETDRMYHVYRKSTFVMNSVAIVLCSGYLCCIQDFILAIFGESFVLRITCAAIITLELLVYLYSIPMISIQNATGEHARDKNQMIVQAVLAVVLGYIGGKNRGMEGILLGLLIPYCIFTLLYKGCVLQECIFKKTKRSFCFFLIKEIIKAICIILLCLKVTSFIVIENVFIRFVLKGIISVICSTGILVLLSWRNEYFKEFIDSLKNRKRG